MPRTLHRRARGFTLIELLMVVIILGVITAVLIPQIGAGMSGTRLATAARTAIQGARYARTMALLNQAETELVFVPEQGIIRIEAAAGPGEHAGIGGPVTEAQAIVSQSDSEDTGEASISGTNRPAAEATAQSFADEIRAEYACEDVQFRFLGYSDSLDATAGGPVDEAAEFRIRFRSNGTCRPFKLRVLFGTDAWMDVVFDVTGAGKAITDAE